MNQRDILGTKVTIDVPKECFALLSDCFSLLEEIDNRFSRFKEDSLLCCANRCLGTWQEIPEDFCFLIQKALEFNRLTHGAFDISIKESLDALGYDAQYSFRPTGKKSSTIIDASVTLKGTRLLLRKEIDFGGIGKGYAIDRVVEFLNGMQVPLFTIDAGGDIFVKGTQRILLEHPDDTSRALGEVIITDQAIAGSAANRRTWGEHHHIINPKTGLPEKSVKAVWVISDSAMDADILATALFAAGYINAIDLIHRLSLVAIVISSEGKIFCTASVKWYDR